VGRRILPAGKLDHEILERLLGEFSAQDERVILGPGIGEDAAAISMGDSVLVVATDPVTFATSEIGYYSVVVNANDVATSGAKPEWYSLVILLPEKEGNEGILEEIFNQVQRACNDLGISLIGGHTEITYGLARPILAGQMIGVTKKDGLIRTAGAQPGDLILLSKGVSVEGTSIIAREKAASLLSKGLSEETLERAKNFLFDPGISIVQEALLASRTGEVNSMHDITEGGLANGLYEIAMAANVSIEIEIDRIPVYKETRELCDLFNIDPLGLIGSGSLLITAPPKAAHIIADQGSRAGLRFTIVGKVVCSGQPSVIFITDEGRKPAPFFPRDEIVKIL